jgi:NADH-quinone oxidoreductase subunit J
MTISFFIFAFVTIAGMSAAMTLRNLVHCVLSLTVGLIGLALLFLELGAQFVGLTQMLVYVGAVAILAMFAMMMTRGAVQQHDTAATSHRISGVVIACGVFLILGWTMYAGLRTEIGRIEPSATVNQIGDALMQRYVLPLEVIGLLLTAALIGAGIIAMEEKRGAQ